MKNAVKATPFLLFALPGCEMVADMREKIELLSRGGQAVERQNERRCFVGSAKKIAPELADGNGRLAVAVQLRQADRRELAGGDADTKMYFVADQICGMAVNTSEADAALAQIKLFPNPVQRGQQVQLQGAEGQELVATLFSASGQVILHTPMTHHLTMPQLPSGVYIIQLQDMETGGMTTQRFIVE